MRRSVRRLLILLAALPVTLAVLALLYMVGMRELEGEPRTFWQSFQWASETLTTTGYGADSSWRHPIMSIFVAGVQFLGVVATFLVFPVFLIPFFEERFEGRLPSKVAGKAGYVLIYRWGPSVAYLVEELGAAGIRVVILEEDLATARRLRDRGHDVVYGSLDEDEAVLGDLRGARGVVANGADAENAVLTLIARQLGFTGPIIALVAEPSRRAPLMRTGATAVFTPRHALAAAVAAKASAKISPRVGGEHRLGKSLEIAEVRVHRGSALVGKTLKEAALRIQTGVTVIGMWIGGRLQAPPSPRQPLEAGTILVVAGSQRAMARLGALTTPVARHGHFLVIGSEGTAHKIAQLLEDAGEEVRLIAHAASGTGQVDVARDLLDLAALEAARIHDAQAVLLALESDAETTFAAAVVRDLVSEGAIIAAVDNPDHVARVHRAGADFVLAMGTVSAQLLSFQLLGEEAIRLQPELKVAKTAAGSLVGAPLLSQQLRERTGCLVIAVERGDDVLVEFDPRFAVQAGDVVYVAGTQATIERYFELMPGTRPS